MFDNHEFYHLNNNNNKIFIKFLIKKRVYIKCSSSFSSKLALHKYLKTICSFLSKYLLTKPTAIEYQHLAPISVIYITVSKIDLKTSFTFRE